VIPKQNEGSSWWIGIRRAPVDEEKIARLLLSFCRRIRSGWVEVIYPPIHKRCERDVKDLGIVHKTWKDYVVF